MSDYIVRAMSKDGFVKMAAICSGEIVARAMEIHGTSPAATAALGRALSAVSLMGNMQKTENGSVTFQIRGGGPVGAVLCVSDAVGNVRGYVENPHAEPLDDQPDQSDVASVVGSDGMLSIIRDLQMKEPYVGRIPLVSGEVDEDVMEYFAQSEQTATACDLDVLLGEDQTVKAAGGYILQVLPGAPDSIMESMEQGIRDAEPLKTMLAQRLTPEEILEKVCGNLELEFLEKTPVCYRCYCSRERVESALISLGKTEMESIRDEGETIHIGCQFCDADYAFTPEDVAEILEKV